MSKRRSQRESKAFLLCAAALLNVLATRVCEASCKAGFFFKYFLERKRNKMETIRFDELEFVSPDSAGDSGNGL